MFSHQPPSSVRKQLAFTIRSTLALSTASVVLVTAYADVRPDLLAALHGILPILFGVCMAALVGIDGSNRGGATGQFSIQPSHIRRSSRLIYFWLYLLVGVSELTAWWCNYPIEAAADKLGGCLIAGIVVLILIRIPAAVHQLRRPKITMRTATPSRAEG